MKHFDHEFWSALDTLVANSKIVIDRPKEQRIPNFPILFTKSITAI